MLKKNRAQRAFVSFHNRILMLTRGPYPRRLNEGIDLIFKSDAVLEQDTVLEQTKFTNVIEFGFEEKFTSLQADVDIKILSKQHYLNLATHIQVNFNLQSLVLYDISMTITGLELLLPALINNTTLLHLNLGQNLFDDACLRVMIPYLQQTTLQTLILNNFLMNRYSTSMIKQIYYILRNNHTLQYLNLIDLPTPAVIPTTPAVKVLYNDFLNFNNQILFRNFFAYLQQHCTPARHLSFQYISGEQTNIPHFFIITCLLLNSASIIKLPTYLWFSIFSIFQRYDFL